ncbi:NAD(P)-binding protein [Athelia psychrophila]|uniref:NAD(P)-binding protein n=1 Tax=Athelia psychrophila TaxID=1759441 RepID=A0A165XLD5_9AGAM|nr:NAD(P)-binding protein [Fibularhizoctonia sp. CBS 109695]
MSSYSRILVTGVSGFLATHVLEQALEAGFSVRGTVRSAEKGRAIQNKHANLGNRFEIAVVEDLVTGDLTQALQNIDAVVHVASPYTGDVKDPKRDMLDPAIEGTMNVVRSAHAAGIKRIIITSSFVATIDLARGGGWRDYTFTADDWNPATYEAAIKGDKPGLWVYCASKALAEKAAWDYAAKYPEIQITTILPPMIYGPPPSSTVSSLNTSSEAIWALISGKNAGPPAEGLPQWVDVRDTAEAHIKALKSEEVIGKRVLVGGGEELMFDAVKLISTKRPNLKARLPSLVNTERDTRPIARIDTSLAETVLGMKFMSWEKCLIDTVDALVEIEKGGATSNL